MRKGDFRLVEFLLVNLEQIPKQLGDEPIYKKRDSQPQSMTTLSMIIDIMTPSENNKNKNESFSAAK